MDNKLSGWHGTKWTHTDFNTTDAHAKDDHQSRLWENGEGYYERHSESPESVSLQFLLIGGSMTTERHGIGNNPPVTTGYSKGTMMLGSTIFRQEAEDTGLDTPCITRVE